MSLYPSNSFVLHLKIIFLANFYFFCNAHLFAGQVLDTIDIYCRESYRSFPGSGFHAPVRLVAGATSLKGGNVMLQLSSEVTKMTYIYLCTYIQSDMATSETYILERGGPNMPVCVVTLQKGERDLACWSERRSSALLVLTCSAYTPR